jgi:hypothetical protein
MVVQRQPRQIVRQSPWHTRYGWAAKVLADRNAQHPRKLVLSNIHSNQVSRASKTNTSKTSKTSKTGKAFVGKQTEQPTDRPTDQPTNQPTNQPAETKPTVRACAHEVSKPCLPTLDANDKPTTDHASRIGLKNI